jgi:RNA polymerase sigma-70 factor (ECF subfamily)
MCGGTVLIDAQSQPDAATVTGDAPADAVPPRDEPLDFEQLVARYQARITRTVHRLIGWGRRGDVEDIVQEVFLAALDHGHAFRGEASVSTWLTAIAVNKCRSHGRRLSVMWRRLVRPQQELADRSGPPSVENPDSLVRAETSQRVREAVQALSPRDREVVVLRYFEELSASEVAQMTRQSRNAVEVRLHRARARLAGALRDVIEEGRLP